MDLAEHRRGASRTQGAYCLPGPEMIALLDEIDRLREHLARIEEWSRAYPKTVFPEPDLKRAAEVLRAGGMTLDAISAHAMRHVVEGVGEIARCGLEGER